MCLTPSPDFHRHCYNVPIPFVVQVPILVWKVLHYSVRGAMYYAEATANVGSTYLGSSPYYHKPYFSGQSTEPVEFSYSESLNLFLDVEAGYHAFIKEYVARYHSCTRSTHHVRPAIIPVGAKVIIGNDDIVATSIIAFRDIYEVAAEYEQFHEMQNGVNKSVLKELD